MAADSPLTASFTAPFNLDAWRILSGAERCENCRTEVAVADIVDDDERPTGERGLFEIVDQPGFGVPHTPNRCRGIRALREAGEEADGHRGRTVVLASREGDLDLLTVRTGGSPSSSDRWADVTWPVYDVINADDDGLTRIAAMTTAELGATLDGRTPQRSYPTGSTIVARS